MALDVFISYSHADDKHVERLRKHMAQLRRDEVFETWTDHAIVPGMKVDDEVFKALRSSQVFIALISPDYINSNYCYEREFQEALDLQEAGMLHIVPIILEPCDWLSSPFSKFVALPKDGKAISEWTNENVAYLNVVQGLRSVATSPIISNPNARIEVNASSAGGRRFKIKQEFDSIQRQEFADQAFDVIRDYFKSSCDELAEIEDLRAKFEKMSESSFTCTIVNRGMRGGREAHITVHNSKGNRHDFGEINYIFEAHAGYNTSNGSIRVDSDDYNMFLWIDGSIGRDGTKYDAKQAADALWLKFTSRVGIDYD